MKLFGTDGIRGRAGAFPLDESTIFLLGQLFGERLRSLREGPEVLLGGDTRESTAPIASVLAQGLAQAGIRVRYAGVLTTPAVALLVRDVGAGAGVSVSASHNPWRDNGIKIFGPDGRKWPDEEEEALEAALLAAGGASPESRVANRESNGLDSQLLTLNSQLSVEPELAELYLRDLDRIIGKSLTGLCVALDLGNGAAFRVGVEAFHQAGAAVTSFADAPDGHNINEGCGALHPEALSSAVASAAVDLGAAFDGDADRSILCEETGKILDGDDMLWMLARAWKREGRLDPPIVVGTVMTNFGLEKALASIGVELRRTPVGDRHIVREMLACGSALGGEPSGHVILGPHSTTGDGVLTALSIARLVAESGRPLYELADLGKSPQKLVSVGVARRVPIEEVPALRDAIADADRRLAGRGRLLVRYSGTEPKLRIMVEGEDDSLIGEIAVTLADAARRELGE